MYILQDYAFVVAPRPAELWVAKNWFVRTFNSTKPGWFPVLAMWCVAVGATVWAWLKPAAWYSRLVLVGALLWLNTLNNSWGHATHVSHAFLYLHLFRTFLPFGHPERLAAEEKRVLMNGLAWGFLLLFATYSMSGFWKVVHIVFPNMGQAQPPVLTWLSPEASYSNTASLWASFGLEVPAIVYPFVAPGLMSQIAFVSILMLQLASFAFAFRFRWLVYGAYLNAFFHLLNVFLFNIHFYSAPFVLLLVFFPYHKLSFLRREPWVSIGKQ